MANIGDLQQVLDLMQMEQQQFGRLHGESLANIDTGIKDLAGINAQMLDAMSAIQQSLAPDTFGAAQATETTRETPGANIVSGPADASSVTPQQGKKKMGMLGMLGIAAAGAAAGLVAAFAGFLDFDAQKVKDKVLILTSIADAVDAGDTAETVATLTSLGVGLAAFGVGSIATGIGQTFMKDDWAVRIKNRDPQVTDLKKDDIIINSSTGTMFYKSKQGLHKIEVIKESSDSSLNPSNSNQTLNNNPLYYSIGLEENDGKINAENNDLILSSNHENNIDNQEVDKSSIVLNQNTLGIGNLNVDGNITAGFHVRVNNGKIILNLFSGADCWLRVLANGYVKCESCICETSNNLPNGTGNEDSGCFGLSSGDNQCEGTNIPAYG